LYSKSAHFSGDVLLILSFLNVRIYVFFMEHMEFEEAFIDAPGLITVLGWRLNEGGE
jgi:Ni,Fe-hydrogenase I cytochrome b subunit